MKYLLLQVTILLINLCYQQNIKFVPLSLLRETYILSNKPGFKSELNFNFERTGQFTISGWIRYEKIQSEEWINVINIFNKPLNKPQKNQSYPDCIFSPDFLQSNPLLKENILVKTNPNCFIFNQPEKEEEKILKILNVYLQEKNNEVFLRFQFPYIYDKKTKLVSNFEEILSNLKVENKDLIFFAISFDYPQGKGEIFYKLFKQNPIKQSQENHKTFTLQLPNLTLNNNFLFSYSENNQADNKSAIYGIISNINLFPIKISILEYLQFFNYDLESKEIDNVYFQLFGQIDQSSKIKSDGYLKKLFELEGDVISNSNGLELRNNSLNLYDILNMPIMEITNQNQLNIFFSIKIKNIKSDYLLFQAYKFQQMINIYLLQVDESSDRQIQRYYIKFIMKYKKRSFTFNSSPFLIQNVITNFGITLSNIEGSQKIIIFLQDEKIKEAQISDTFFHVFYNFNELEYKLFDETNKQNQIVFYRFIILKSILPFLQYIENNQLVSKNNQNCDLNLSPSFSNTKCLTCINSVLIPKTNECIEYCPANTKNIAGICLNCQKPNCEEIKPTTLQIQRIQNEEFVIQLTREIPFMNLGNLKYLFDLELENNKIEIDYTYSIKLLNPTQLLLTIHNKKPIYNTYLKIQFRKANNLFLYDENRNYIYELKSEYKIWQMYYIQKEQSLLKDFCVFIIIAIFVLTFIGGIVLFLIGMENNINEYVTKQFVKLLQSIQFIPFLLLFNVNFPSNLHGFLTDLLEFFLNLNGCVKLWRSSDQYVFSNYKPHPNFYDKEFHRDLIDNFGLIVIFHFLLALIYGLFCLLKYFKQNFSFRSQSLFFKMKENIEFNFLIISFFLFINQIWVFVTINLETFVISQFKNSFSMFISLIYVWLVIFFTITFTILFISTNGFLTQSEIKYKLSFLFIGYKNRKYSNFYEFLNLFIQIVLISFLTLFRMNPLYQISTFVSLYFLFYVYTILFNPFENRKVSFINIISQSLILFVLILISSLGSQDYKFEYNYKFRENIGWIIIFVLVINIAMNFITWSFSLFKFIKKIISSRKLIFNENDENVLKEIQSNSKNFQKIRSTDKISTENQNDKKKFGKFGNLSTLQTNHKQIQDFVVKFGSSSEKLSEIQKNAQLKNFQSSFSISDSNLSENNTVNNNSCKHEMFNRF